jgi:hypothetical protein
MLQAWLTAVDAEHCNIWRFINQFEVPVALWFKPQTLSINAPLDYRLQVSAFKHSEGGQSSYLVFSIFTSYPSSRQSDLTHPVSYSSGLGCICHPAYLGNWCPSHIAGFTQPMQQLRIALYLSAYIAHHLPGKSLYGVGHISRVLTCIESIRCVACSWNIWVGVWRRFFRSVDQVKTAVQLCQSLVYS